VDVQLDYLERHTGAPYRVWAYLDGEPAAARAGRFDDAVVEELGPRAWHADKLNLLAERIAAVADPEDRIVFIDGDAFPITKLGERIEAMLGERPLAAVRRAENLSDPQPHPCFCVTTVGFWSEIGGDWRQGPQWQNSSGGWQSDVGARLMVALRERDVEWTELLRTNRRDLHPIMFGVYGDLVYHHGAGFRESLTRLDSADIRRRVAAIDPPAAERDAVRERLRQERAAANARLEAEVFERLRSDPQFWRELFY
jgi:hypothetical protein